LTTTIVFMGVGDPVAAGLVASLARPGGNFTGFSNMYIELQAKRLELLSELVPLARVIALLVNGRAEHEIRVVQEAARAKGVQLPVVKASTEGEIDAAFASLVELRNDMPPNTAGSAQRRSTFWGSRSTARGT
jgi:putative ABC transport system substrate-binding protein